MSTASRALDLLAQKRRDQAVFLLSNAGGHQAALNLLLTRQDAAAVTVLRGQVARDAGVAAAGASPEAVQAPGGVVGP